MDKELLNSLYECADDEFVEDVLKLFELASILTDDEEERVKQTLTCMAQGFIGHSADLAGVYG